MAAKFSVSILPRAEADFDSIYSWICERSPQGAKRWSDAFEAIVNRIADSPQEFASAVEAEILQRPIKQALFKTTRGRTYRLLFIVSKNDVYVLRIRGAGQLPLQADEI